MRQLGGATGSVETEAVARFDVLTDRTVGPLALAVSGGSDSTALMCLAHDWARARGQDLVCFIVDHGLRPEAVDEARHVAAEAEALGIEHLTLKWEAPRSGQSAARVARHALLAEAARKAGATQIAFGHTLDDQVETFLIRARQGSTWYGLGGMDPVAPSPVWPSGRGLTLIRPLLGFRRDALRDVLRVRGIGWIDEPSNADLSFERVRMRQWIADAPQLRGRLERTCSGLSRLRRLQNRSLALSFAVRVTAHEDGTLAFDPGRMTTSAILRILPVLIQVAAGHADPVSGHSLLQLAKEIAAGGPETARTLGGAWVGRLPDKSVLLARDPGAVPGHGRLVCGLWDGRFQPGGQVQPVASHTMAKPGLPPAGPGWRAICADRIQALCTIWRQNAGVSQCPNATGVDFRRPTTIL